MVTNIKKYVKNTLKQYITLSVAMHIDYPKLDNNDYSEKLTEIIEIHDSPLSIFLDIYK